MGRSLDGIDNLRSRPLTLADVAIVRNSGEKRQTFGFALSFDTFVVSDGNVNESVFHEDVLLGDFR
jgi:hypothetical protein